MRKFLVKFFALDYVVRIFGRSVNFTRSANILFPLLLTTMTLYAFNFTYWWVSFSLFFLASFFGFFYFRIKPLDFEDIDYMDEVQVHIWFVSNNKRFQSEKTPYNGTWVFFVNPFFIFIFLISFFLLY